MNKRNPLAWMKLDPLIVAGEVDGLTVPEQGAYFILIRHLWPKGPMSAEEIRRYLGEYADRVIARLRPYGDGLSMPWLEGARGEADEFREQRAGAGRKSAAKRSTTVQRPLNDRSTADEHNTVEENTVEEKDSKEEQKERAPKGAARSAPDPRITELVEHLKSVNGGAIDGMATSRRDCSTLLKQMARDFPDFDAAKSVRTLIDRSKGHPWHGPRASSFAYLVRHRVSIINELKNPANGTKRTSLDPEQVHRNVDAAVDRLIRDGIIDGGHGK